MINITSILVAVITVITSIITAFAIPWLKTKISADKQMLLISISEAVVFAVEQIFKSLDGPAKKTEAVGRVKEWLKKYKIELDDVAIDAAIESAVKKMNIEIKGI